jgi:hypothetical protein
MECVWTDYVGSTEDCWEVVGCTDQLYYYSEFLGDVTIWPNVEGPIYDVNDFTLNSPDTITLVLSDELSNYITGDWDFIVEVYAEDVDPEPGIISVGCTLDSIVPSGDSFVYTFIYPVQAGYITSLTVSAEEIFFAEILTGIGIGNRDVVNFCTPLPLGAGEG